MSSPKISVFISYYNDEKFLNESIRSILDQTFEDFELILLDHASQDGSKKIAYSFNDSRIVHLSMDRNIGGGGSEVFLNILHKARGRYLKTFCADDIMDRGCLETLYNEAERGGFDLVFSDMDTMLEDGKIIGNGYDFRLANNKNEAFLIKSLFDGMSPIPYPTALIKLEKIKSEYVCRVGIQLFDLRLWANLLLNGCKARFVDRKLVKYRVHGKQLSGVHLGKKISNRLAFEEFHLLDLFLNKMTFNLAKNVFGADVIDEKILEFDLCTIALKSKNQAIRSSALHHLFKILQNDKTRKDVEEIRGFNISKMRSLMSDDCYSIHKSNATGMKLITFVKSKIIVLLLKLGIYNAARGLLKKICRKK